MILDGKGIEAVREEGGGGCLSGRKVEAVFRSRRSCGPCIQIATLVLLWLLHVISTLSSHDPSVKLQGLTRSQHMNSPYT